MLTRLEMPSRFRHRNVEIILLTFPLKTKFQYRIHRFMAHPANHTQTITRQMSGDFSEWVSGRKRRAKMSKKQTRSNNRKLLTIKNCEY